MPPSFILLSAHSQSGNLQVVNSAMQSTPLTKLIRFLQEELAIPSESIDFVLRQEESMPNLLPMVLWQYGLVTLEQLDQILTWLEAI